MTFHFADYRAEAVKSWRGSPMSTAFQMYYERVNRCATEDDVDEVMTQCGLPLLSRERGSEFDIWPLR